MSTALLETLTDPVEGLAGPDFYAYFLDQKNLFEYNDQTPLDNRRLLFDTIFGRGIIEGTYSGPLITAGAGLTVDVGAHYSLIQDLLILTGTTTWSLPDNTTDFYLWELFTNTDASPAYATVLDATDPSTDEIPAHLIAKLTTSGGSVTSLTELFNIVLVNHPLRPAVTEVYGPTYSTPYQKLWDADVTLRTGGTESASVDVQQDVDILKPITILRGTGEDVSLAKDRSWTFSAPRTFHFVDGKRPVDNGTTIREDVSITYSPL